MALEIQEEGILIFSKTLKGKLVEICVKSYIQKNLFKIINTNKIKNELYDLISKNIIYDSLRIKTDLVNSGDLFIQIFIDKMCIDCHILQTGKTISFDFENGDGPITKITE